MRPIDADRLKVVLEKNFGHTGGASVLEQLIDEQPTIQPEESTEKRTETHACDLISRQAAIDAYGDWYVEEGTAEGFIGTVKQLLEGLHLHSQTPCVNAIDALNESIKHFDDMAEECRRNANIERNDYMDMRDDAAEYRQLSIWLNELKWLRERAERRTE